MVFCWQSFGSSLDPAPLSAWTERDLGLLLRSPLHLMSFSLRQAVKQLLELPLNLAVVSPAHTPNWDLVSDVVNSCSRVYRSPKQCRNRYENVVIPREEGKVGFAGDVRFPPASFLVCRQR